MSVTLTERVGPASRYARAADRLIRQRDRLTAGQARRVRALLRDVRAEVMADLQRQAADADTYRAWQLRQLRDAIDQAAAGLASRLRPVVDEGVRRAWEAGDAFAPTALAAAGLDVGVGVGLRAINVGALAVARELAADRVRGVSDQFRSRANLIIARGVMGATSPFQVWREVGALLRAGPTRAGMGTVAWQAERIQRTEMLSAFALADEARTRALADAVPGLLKVWDAVSDSRTRPAHAAAGRRYDEAGAIPVGQDFVLGGVKCAGPHDPRLPASQTVLCRCVKRLWSPQWGQAPEPEPVAPPEPQPFGSVAEAHEWAGDKFKPWREGLTPAENDAIRGYQSTTYGAMNTALRNNDREAIAARKEQIGHLDRALARSPLDRGVVVHRFYSGRAADQLDRPDRQLIGAEFSDPAFLSTSFDRSHVHTWAGYAINEGRPVVIAEIRVPAGTKAGYLGEGFLGDSIATEYELLLARGARFRVVEVGEDSFLDYDDKRQTVKKVVLEVVG